MSLANLLGQLFRGVIDANNRLAAASQELADRTHVHAEQARFELAAQDRIKTEQFSGPIEERVMKQAQARDEQLTRTIQSELARDVVLAKLYAARLAELGPFKTVLDRQVAERATLQMARTKRSHFADLIANGPEFRRTYYNVLKRYSDALPSPPEDGNERPDRYLYVFGRHIDEWLAEIEGPSKPALLERRAGWNPQPAPAVPPTTPVAVQEANRPLTPLDRAYVTRHTFTRLSRERLALAHPLSIDELFARIYEKRLDEILRKDEAQQVYLQKLMVEGETESLKVDRRTYSPAYVFSVGAPRFHLNHDCEYMKSDFSNFLVPPEIKVLGPEKVRELQLFCEANKRDFTGKSDDAFWAHVGAHFRMPIRPQPVLVFNSGYEELTKLPLRDLRVEIDRTIEAVHAMLEHPETGPTLKRIRYAPSLRRAQSLTNDKNSADCIEKFFRSKLKLLAMLVELYRKQKETDHYGLPLEMLRAAGLEPCRVCGSRSAG